ncbi:MAG: hypothetical protein ABWZ82_05700 [Candidatus Limnocylindrales bacterium]
MRTLREVGPLGVVVALVGGVTWMLLSGHDALGVWLLAGLLLAHGLVHVMFLVPSPPHTVVPSTDGPDWPFDLGQSWLAGRLGTGAVRMVGRYLVIAVVALAALAALGTVGVPMSSARWAALVVGSAGASLVLLAIDFRPSLALGVAIDLALLWLALWSSWTPVS